MLPAILKSDANTNEPHRHLTPLPALDKQLAVIRLNGCGPHTLDRCAAEVGEFQFHKGLVDAFASIR